MSRHRTAGVLKEPEAMLSAQQILMASLDYRRILARTGMTLSMQTRRVLNGQTEFLCARAELEDWPRLEAARHAHGEPTHPRPTADTVRR